MEEAKGPKVCNHCLGTDEELKERMNYDSTTGIFTWKKHKLPSSIGKTFGTLKNDSGYLCVRFNYKNYYLHRLAWFFHYGKHPDHQIDHINGNRTDNRITNLRDVTQRKNCQNFKIHRNGKLVGANYHIGHKKWQAKILINGKRITLGFFETEQEAHNAYIDAIEGLDSGQEGA